MGATHGKCKPMDTNRGAVGGWGIRWLCLSLSVGYPWVTPVGFTHGCVLLTALRFLLPMMFVISDARAVRPYLLMEWAAGAKVGHSFIHVSEYSLAIPNITLYLCPKICMHIISRSTLVAYYERNPQSKVALEDWFNKTSRASWTCFADVKQTFNSVDNVGNQHYVFNIKGNDYRLVVVIQFTPKRVYIRFVGTHAEYDRIKDIQNI